MPPNAAKVPAAVRDALEDGDNELPMALRALAEQMEHIRALEAGMAAIEKRLAGAAASDVPVANSIRFRRSTIHQCALARGVHT